MDSDLLPIPPAQWVQLLGCSVDLVTGRLARGRDGRLTERERTLLCCLVACPGEPISQHEIAERFGYSRRTTTRAVDKAMYTLRRKVERDPKRPEHLITRYGVGYVFLPVRPEVEEEPDETPAPPTVSPPVRLPNARSAFVGRTRELELFDQQVRMQRLVSVIGLGGTGKSRLVVEGARRHNEQDVWPGGIHFCDLVDAHTTEQMVGAIARCLGVVMRDPLGDRIEHCLRHLGQALLIIDNAERVTEPLRQALERWMAGTTELHIVVTTREPLGLALETRFLLGPLAEEDAPSFYLHCAGTARPGFRLSEEDEAALPELLGLLDRLPLAIEFAAARVRVLPPSRLLPRLSDRFRLLASTRRIAARHSSLAGVLDWSFELLSEDERSGLAQLSVFEGGFTIEAAEAVVQTGGFTLDILQRLVELSWVTPAAEDRFRLLVSAQEYAMSKLDDVAQAHRRHGTWFARTGARLRAGAATHPLDVRQDLENVVVACRRAVARGDVPTAVDTLLAAFVVMSDVGPFSSWIGLAECVRALELPSDLEAEMALRLGDLLVRSARLDEADQVLERGLAAARACGGNTVIEGRIAAQQAWGRMMSGQAEGARDSLTVGEQVLERQGDARLRVAVLSCQAWLYRDQRNVEEARVTCEAALRASQEVGDLELHARTLVNVASSRWMVGGLVEAREGYETARELYASLDNRFGQAGVTGLLGTLASVMGQEGHARTLLNEAIALHRRLGSTSFAEILRSTLGVVLLRLGLVAAARKALEGALAFQLAHDNVREACYARVRLCKLERRQRRFKAAAVLLDEAEARCGDLGLTYIRHFVNNERACLLVDQEHYTEAERLVSRQLPWLNQCGNRMLLADALITRAEAHAGRGNRGLAHRDITAAEEQISKDHGPLQRRLTRIRASLEPSD
ncbi:MAG: winged helix-turn-helix domain-containing protein [Myxococcota bacterium]